MLLALTHAELGGMYPVAGGNARFPSSRLREADRLHERLGRIPGRRDRGADHGRGHPPVRVELRLLADDGLGRAASADTQGYVVAGTLLLLFCTINVMGVRWLAETNKLAVCWKLLDPVCDGRRARL